MVKKNSLLTAVLPLTTTSQKFELLTKLGFSIFLKTMFRLLELNLYTCTVNIANILVKPCKIIFFKIFPNNWRGFSFRVDSRISLLTLFYHSLSLYYSLKVHISINLLLRGMLFLFPYDD